MYSLDFAAYLFYIHIGVIFSKLYMLVLHIFICVIPHPYSEQAGLGNTGQQLLDTWYLFRIDFFQIKLDNSIHSFEVFVVIFFDGGQWLRIMEHFAGNSQWFDVFACSLEIFKVLVALLELLNSIWIIHAGWLVLT